VWRLLRVGVAADAGWDSPTETHTTRQPAFNARTIHLPNLTWKVRSMGEHLAIAAAFGGLGILMSIVGYKLFDLIETKIDFAEEIKKGNIAASIVIAGFLIGICFIIGRTVGS